MTGLREVEVTVLVPERHDAVDVAADILKALGPHSADLAIHVKICAIEEEEDKGEA